MSRLMMNQNKVQISEYKERMEILREIFSYLSYLNASGQISNKGFKILVRYACANFIENQVELMIQDALEDKLEQFWLNNLPNLDKYWTNINKNSYNSDLSRLLRNK